jgi:hypothetical protein
MTDTPTQTLQLSPTFREFLAPQSGRRIIQLTKGDAFNYPLYYYIPSFTRDGRYLIHHRADAQGVQIWRLELATGQQAQLSHGTGADTRWFPWCVDKGPGVLDHRSVLNVPGNSVVYFDGADAIEVDVESLERRLLFRLPTDRVATGQNCVSADGEWFVYIHHDKATSEKMRGLPYWEARVLSKGTALCAHHLATGEHRDLLFINSPIHHVLPSGSEGLVFCHPNTENGMLWTTLQGGFYTHLRTQDAAGRSVCHHLSTARGVMYEVSDSRGKGTLAGVYDPDTHWCYELPLPPEFGYTHTGWDPEGALWIFENESSRNGKESSTHELWFLREHVSGGMDEWVKLIGDWTNFGGGQSAHCHPQVTPDRNWLLFTGGDQETRSNQLHLLDISDLRPTEGIPGPMSPASHAHGS